MSVKRMVWSDQLDGRFDCVVVTDDNNPYKGMLEVTDALQENKVVFNEPVFVSFGAPFGADARDIEDWSAKVIDFIDHRYYR